MGVITLSSFDMSSRRRGPDIRGKLSALAESGPALDLSPRTGNHGSGNGGDKGPQLLRWMPRSISLTAANSTGSGLFSPNDFAKSRKKKESLLGNAEEEGWGMIGCDSPNADDDLNDFAKGGGVASSWDFEAPTKSRSLSLRSLTKFNLSFGKQPALKRTLSDRTQPNYFNGEFNKNTARDDNSGNLVSSSTSSSFVSKAHENVCDAEFDRASETASSSECGSVVGDSDSSDWSNDNHNDAASSHWKEWDAEERTSKVPDEKKQEKRIAFVREFFPANRAGHIRRFLLKRFGGSLREKMHVWAVARGWHTGRRRQGQHSNRMRCGSETSNSCAASDLFLDRSRSVHSFTMAPRLEGATSSHHSVSHSAGRQSQKHQHLTRLVPKKTYKPLLSLEVFYTGGHVAVFPDGRHVACPCADAVKIVDLTTGKVVRTLEGDGEQITAVAASPDGVSAYPLKPAFAPRCSPLLPSTPLCSPLLPSAPLYSPLLPSTPLYSPLLPSTPLYSPLLPSTPLYSPLLPSAPVDASGALLATGGADRGAHPAPVSCMAVDASGGLLATGGADRGVRVWDLEANACTHSFTGMGGVLSCVAFHPDPNQLLLVGTSESGLVRVWDLVTKRDGDTCPLSHSPPFPPPLPQLVGASESGLVRVWDLVTKRPAASLDKHFSTVTAIAFSPSGWLLLTASRDKVVNIWDIRTYAHVTTIPVRVWDVTTGACLAMGSGHVAAVAAVAFSQRPPPDQPTGGKGGGAGPFLVSGSSDRTLKVWPLALLLASSAAALPRGRGGVLRLKSGATVAAHDKDINAVAVAPNDALVCSGSQDRTAKVWKLPDLSLSVTLRGHKRGVWSVAFSPVDRCVLTASGDATCRIWALADGSCLRTLQGHEASVLKAIFVTRGTQVVSTGADGLLKLWSVKGGECVNTFDEHEDKIWALAVSPGSEMLATGGSDSLVHVWQDCTQQEQEEAALEQVKAVQQEQAMRNAAVAEDYVTALQLALQLQRPATMAALLSDLMKKEGAEERIGGAVAGLEPSQLRQLLLYAREWNTNAKLCLSAQRLLSAVLKHHPPATLMQIPGIGEILDGLQPYTQRHLARLERVLRSSYLVDYSLAALTMLQPTADLALQPEAELALKVAGSGGKAALALQAKAAAQERPSGLEVLKEKPKTVSHEFYTTTAYQHPPPPHVSITSSSSPSTSPSPSSATPSPSYPHNIILIIIHLPFLPLLSTNPQIR
ncbi:unnamed protein product [Closterium sp. Yama58-4]|nr:unnamed protein product [Closterium sp. Yama58-4]